MICPNCERVNSSKAKFCGGCGLVLEAETESFVPAPVVAAHSQNTGGVEYDPNTTTSAYGGDSQAPGFGFRDNSQKFCIKGHTTPGDKNYCTVCQKLMIMPAQTLLNNRWAILEMLAEGGMGRVYTAFDSKSGDTVVVKEMLDEEGLPQTKKQLRLKYFHNEVEILGSLSQVRSVPRLIQGILQEGPRHYFVMEYIDGDDLERIVTRSSQPLDVATVVTYAIKVCEVLEILHNRNPQILHRDIKPENLRLRKSDGSVALLDFGIARNIQTGGQQTLGPGTNYFIAPEQRDGRADGRADLYSLAATMYYILLTGKPPEYGIHLPGEIRRANANVSPGIERIILANLHHDPDERHDSASDLMRDLRLGEPTETINCPRCNHPNDRRRIYCTQDGAPLSNRVRACQNQQDCGRFIPFKSKFCPYCGTKVD